MAEWKHITIFDRPYPGNIHDKLEPLKAEEGNE